MLNFLISSCKSFSNVTRSVKDTSDKTKHLLVGVVGYEKQEKSGVMGALTFISRAKVLRQSAKAIYGVAYNLKRVRSSQSYHDFFGKWEVIDSLDSSLDVLSASIVASQFFGRDYLDSNTNKNLDKALIVVEAVKAGIDLVKTLKKESEGLQG